jgi:hypothetical protein
MAKSPESLLENMQGIYNLEDLGVKGSIILNVILNK